MMAIETDRPIRHVLRHSLNRFFMSDAWLFYWNCANQRVFISEHPWISQIHSTIATMISFCRGIQVRRRRFKNDSRAPEWSGPSRTHCAMNEERTNHELIDAANSCAKDNVVVLCVRFLLTLILGLESQRN